MFKYKSTCHFAKNMVLIQFRASPHEPGWSASLSFQGLAPLVFSLSVNFVVFIQDGPARLPETEMSGFSETGMKIFQYNTEARVTARVTGTKRF